MERASLTKCGPVQVVKLARLAQDVFNLRQDQNLLVDPSLCGLFLLRRSETGPCRHEAGHARRSAHRTQTPGPCPRRDPPRPAERAEPGPTSQGPSCLPCHHPPCAPGQNPAGKCCLKRPRYLRRLNLTESIAGSHRSGCSIRCGLGNSHFHICASACSNGNFRLVRNPLGTWDQPFDPARGTFYGFVPTNDRTLSKPLH